MDIQALTGLATFAFVSSVTPGPNNLMLMTSGANYGLRRTIPHLMGVTLGFMFLVVVIGLGLMQLFEAFPLSYTLMRLVSVLYLLYLAARIAIAAPALNASDTRGRPFTFVQAAGFQWVNPKAWSIGLAAISTYAPVEGLLGIFAVALVFGLVNLPCVSAWAALGTALNRFLAEPHRIRAFNYVMALLLIGSLYPVLQN